MLWQCSKHCMGATPLLHFKDGLWKQYYYPSSTWSSCNCIPSPLSLPYFCGTHSQPWLTATAPWRDKLVSPLVLSITLVARHSIRLNMKLAHFSVFKYVEDKMLPGHRISHLTSHLSHLTGHCLPQASEVRCSGTSSQNSVTSCAEFKKLQFLNSHDFLKITFFFFFETSFSPIKTGFKYIRYQKHTKETHTVLF